MDVYWYCQGGEQVIESIKNMQFADGKINVYTTHHNPTCYTQNQCIVNQNRSLKD